jgi:hypothetical protein
MPVRVKPPPAEIGEIISPGCTALATTTPLNGARTTVLSSCTWATPTDSCATLICSSVLASRAPEHVALRESSFQCLRTDELPVGEPLLAHKVPLGLDELGANLGELGTGSSQLSLGQCELGLGLGILEPGEHITLLDPHAFLNQDLCNFPGNLR